MCIHRRGQSPLIRTPSPRRHLHHDIGFSDTVSNVVEIVKEEHRRGRPYGHGHRYTRGRNYYTIHYHQMTDRCCVKKEIKFFDFQFRCFVFAKQKEQTLF